MSEWNAKSVPVCIAKSAIHMIYMSSTKDMCQTSTEHVFPTISSHQKFVLQVLGKCLFGSFQENSNEHFDRRKKF